MINQNSIKAVQAAQFGSHFCRPLYETYGFSKIPGTVKKLLGVPCATLPSDCIRDERYDSVVLFLIDAFGWKFFEKYKDKYPFLNRFLKEGIASKLTAQFPSTTAAHITCLNSDLEVGQHGVYEWFYYEPTLDRMIAPLLFSFAGDKEPGTLLKTGVSLEKLAPYETVYQQLAAKNIYSAVLQPASIAHSPYSEWVFRGAENLSYTDFAAGIKLLAQKMQEKKGYFYVYFGDIDAEAHRHGTESREVDAVIDSCFSALEEFFWKATAHLGQKVGVIVTADHGMIDVDPKTTFYVNEEIPSFSDYIQRNKAGDLLVPAGSCRDFFLHLKPERLNEGLALLRSHLQESAAVFSTEELMQQQFFGSKPLSEAFLKRVGNGVILPYRNESIWWHEKHRFEQRFHAMHGGLSRDEMETVFLFNDR
jgi:hypothetical protein